jgi:hypothetical protein
LLSVYISGITATAPENPRSDDLPISIRRLSRRLHEPESPVGLQPDFLMSVLTVTQPGAGSGGTLVVTMMEPAQFRSGIPTIRFWRLHAA